MDLANCRTRLRQSAAAIVALAEGITPEQARWKPTPEEWSLLEVICTMRSVRIFDNVSISRCITLRWTGRRSIRRHGRRKAPTTSAICQRWWPPARRNVSIH
jgi:hypothetical protein